MHALLKKLLEEEHSKKQKDIIVKEILTDKIPLKSLIKVIHSNNGIYAQRGAYVITGLHDEAPHLLTQYIPELLDSIKPDSHQAIPRAVYRYLTEADIPEDFEGELFEKGMQQFISKKTPIAVKAHLMTILTRISIKYPELQHEVIFAIKDQLPDSSKGYQSRANRELKILKA
tara:strand:+ start:1080 stop:1598 length:519 start_codon:yes stop_codon:yes gene_type:complete